MEVQDVKISEIQQSMQQISPAAQQTEDFLNILNQKLESENQKLESEVSQPETIQDQDLEQQNCEEPKEAVCADSEKDSVKTDEVDVEQEVGTNQKTEEILLEEVLKNGVVQEVFEQSWQPILQHEIQTAQTEAVMYETGQEVPKKESLDIAGQGQNFVEKDLQTKSFADISRNIQPVVQENITVQKGVANLSETQMNGMIQVREGSVQNQSVPESLSDMAEVLKQNSAGHSVVQQQVPSDEEKSTVSIEELQKYVDEKLFSNSGELAFKMLSGGYEVQSPASGKFTAAQPVMEQIQVGIHKGISNQLETFTICLKPEGLGEILVHLESSGGKIAMSIGVSSAQTQKMLDSEMLNLRELLKPFNAEVKEIYQSQPQAFDMMTNQQNMFQRQRNQFYGGNAVGTASYRNEDIQEQAMHPEADVQKMYGATVYTAGGWNAYV